MKNINRGAVTLLFIMIIAMVLVIIMSAAQSRLLLSLRRSQSAADILIATYRAESEANDVMARLVGGYLPNASFSPYSLNVDDMRIDIEGEDRGNTQIVTVTALRGFAVGKVQAVRRILSVDEVDNVEIVLVLDCTSSMNSSSGTPNQSRFSAQEDAAVNFIRAISLLSDSDKFKVGVGVFGTTSAWLQYNGRSVTPGSGLSFQELVAAIEQGFGATRSQSQCGTEGSLGFVEDATSVGTAFRHAHDYLKTTKEEGKKQIEIIITDGEPNSKTADFECPEPDLVCRLGNECEVSAKNYLRCTAADRATFVSEINQNGVRDPDVDAYAVTIFDRPPVDVVEIFQNYITEGGYFNASQASQLSGILDKILVKILDDRSTVSVKRVVPLPQ